jgi:hypothetical protein
MDRDQSRPDGGTPPRNRRRFAPGKALDNMAFALCERNTALNVVVSAGSLLVSIAAYGLLASLVRDGLVQLARGENVSSDWYGPLLRAPLSIWWAGAAGLVVIMFVHELGHFVWAWVLGMGPVGPVFNPLTGASIRRTAKSVDAVKSAWMKLWGPLAGSLSALALGIYQSQTHSGLAGILALVACIMNGESLLPFNGSDGQGVALVWWRRDLFRRSVAPNRDAELETARMLCWVHLVLILVLVGMAIAVVLGR